MTAISRRRFVESAAAAAVVPLLPDIGAPLTHTLGPIDGDLLEVTIPRLHALYDAKKYTPRDVTRWYLDRIAKYNPVYRALLHVDTSGALATAARLGSRRDPRMLLWGVPMVIKANTSVKGLITSAGWWGFNIPGQQLVAPTDATVVRKLRAAGAIILAQTNMPDFAASDTNFSTVFGRTGNAYNVRCSPGGSSGGTVTAVTANFCVAGTGTDTANSIRMPAGTSSVVGVLPTRGRVSIAGIVPLNWLLDNTGPIARTVTDASLVLDVMSGPDPLDFRTSEAASAAEPGPFAPSLSGGSLRGKRFGVPAFIMKGPPADASTPSRTGTPLTDEARAAFMKAIDGIRAAGGSVVFDDALLGDAFVELERDVHTGPFHNEGMQDFLRAFGPRMYRSAEAYAQTVGTLIPGFERPANNTNAPVVGPFATDPQAETGFWAPRRRALAAYDETLQRFQLDGYVYPSAQMPPNDELRELADGRRSGGPHSNTGWVNPLGVPAVVVPGGFYDSGLPFGVEFAGALWKDGEVLRHAYAYEQATKHRKPPTLTAA